MVRVCLVLDKSPHKHRSCRQVSGSRGEEGVSSLIWDKGDDVEDFITTSNAVI